MLELSSTLLARCISIDLEVDPRSARVFAFAAVNSNKSNPLVYRGGNPDDALQKLDAFVSDCDHLIGHNILRFDLPHLMALRPRLAALGKSPIDTLWLNPLAFPRNPYHHLVKHYHDGRLQTGHVNHPERDAQLVFKLLEDQLAAFSRLNLEHPDALLAYHYLATRSETHSGFDAVFRTCRTCPTPSSEEARAAIQRLLAGRACAAQTTAVLEHVSDPNEGWPLAYALSWISVAGGDSVMPPWVRAQFPDAARIVRELRDSACGSNDCAWCREKNDPKQALSRWFGFDNFRPQPMDEHGRPLQERIVDEAMRGRSILGILPTGTGKSVCYQVPALSKFDKTGVLSVVISPLVALMADQVQGLARVGITSAVTVNGTLSLPERQHALDRVRLGDAAMLLISPEQLRSKSVRSVLAQREVGLWVLDEAHCVSKWGHDFRPDYRYISRFIREFSGDRTPAPVLCLTATAKPEVVRDIRGHFKTRLSADLLLLDGGAVRTNLTFNVLPTQKETKLSDILDAIEGALPPEGASGAIVYCATRRETERVADFLKQQNLSAEHFHAGMTSEEKRDIQERFRTGSLRIIAATNAFGMGIDKPDIRLVVHGDIPGSLENYLQEAGRAGRDRAPAKCVLLFAEEDIERQFSMSARSRLERHEIGAILKALRRIDIKTGKRGEVVATSGEIVRSELDREFERDSTTDDTRVKTAVSWLEEASLLTREENRVQVFPSSLRVSTLEAATAILKKSEMTEARRNQLISIVHHLMTAPRDSGISTDELSSVTGLSGSGLNKALTDLETLGIARNDTAITVFLHSGVEGQSSQRLEQASRLEADLIALMRELNPDADVLQHFPLHLPIACQTLRDKGHSVVRPDIIDKILGSLTQDGRDEDGGTGSIHKRRVTSTTSMIRLQRSWSALERTSSLRRQAARLLLEHLLGKVPKGVRGKDIQVETTLGDLVASVKNDAVLFSEVQNATKLTDRAMMSLHELEVVTLGKGLTVFRPAMTLYLRRGSTQFTQKDYAPLEEHYEEKTLQTHVIATYAKMGIDSIDKAQQLSEDYFVLDRDTFVRRWLPGRTTEIRRQTTGESWQRIVEVLDNPTQQKIVSDDRERTNVLVLAGPGSGKTRVLVHRIAYLVRVKREDPSGILVLSYNRHAAAEIRDRLRNLLGDDAQHVTVSTCHALAMRLVGASFAKRPPDASYFSNVMTEAVELLQGNHLSPSEAEAQRDTLIRGFRWILVDEYQDIGPNEYALISAVAGRSLDDDDLRLSLFAVGDDDQNIYAFAGASITYIRRFEEDYKAKPAFLVENYRSTRHIVETANAVIAGAKGRLKDFHPITVDRRREKDDPGGSLERLDPVARGRVQLLHCSSGSGSQAVAAVDELVRLSHLISEWSWARTAIIARNWRQLEYVRAYAEGAGIPVEMANERLPSIWRLREMQHLVDALRQSSDQLVGATELASALRGSPPNQWTKLIEHGVTELGHELSDKKMPALDAVEWLAEWAQDTRSAQRGLLLLTAHRAKGLEFDDVVIIDSDWGRLSKDEDPDAPRRLFYVAMTRARRSLSIVTAGEQNFLDAGLHSTVRRHVIPDANAALAVRRRYQMPDVQMVDLSYAGRLDAGNPALNAIKAAQVGDPISLTHEGGRWLVKDTENRTIGRMAQRFVFPEGLPLLRGTIGAIIRWRRSDSDEAFQNSMRRDEWEVILPELVFG